LYYQSINQSQKYTASTELDRRGRQRSTIKTKPKVKKKSKLFFKTNSIQHCAHVYLICAA